ncbi:MAG TPA: hydroxymethylbilane synthase [Candidatus Acidoferrales bacterium]|nr:hydroxymethylbilane synthase [Candidatus Acidoferrales bacterium]
MKPLRIGTRGSALALWQANHVGARLAELRGVEAEIVRIHTAGDKFPTAAIAQIGSEGGAKGVFIKEIEDALLAGAVDLAVHSMKDVPTELPKGLAIAAITRREDPRDCLISHTGDSLERLPRGARIGTSSLRRQAQLRHFRADLQVLDLRGNVDTRLRKAAAGEFDAIVLALAGIARLGAAERITQALSAEVMLPAVGQGALGIEARAEDSETMKLAALLDDAESRACVTAERALLRTLEGGCQVPLGAWARLHAGTLHLEACVLSPDGSESVRRETHGHAADAERIGAELGKLLIEAGADRILRLAGREIGSGK